MAHPLVTGIDGSDESLAAVDWAVDEAARLGLRLRLVHASCWERYERAVPSHGLSRPPEHVIVENLVACAAERAARRNPDVKVTTEIVTDDPVDALLREADNAFAVVTGVRGRGELTSLLLGSVSLTVAAWARCPVIVVRGHKAGLAPSHERILLGAGEPATGAEAVRFAFNEAEARGCALDVVRAWRRPRHESPDGPALADEPAHRYEGQASEGVDALLRDAVADHRGVQVRRVTVEGPAHSVLVRRSAAADLVIVGARRRHGHLGLQLGRVSHTLLHHADCPVAVVPHTVSD
ncbi:universal stress protein [Streptomyces sp. NPDC018036]|uniref:universal stress protein n=1 Tax=Streptomyces sp. NPDC018036 TaxID=3365035 RepID=UPI0037AD7E94